MARGQAMRSALSGFRQAWTSVTSGLEFSCSSICSTSGTGQLPSWLRGGLQQRFAHNLQIPGASASTAGSSVASSERAASRTLAHLLRDYKQLSKFKLSALVMLTASAGFAAGSGDSIDFAGMLWTSLGTLGAAACANTLNQLYEVSNDARMNRTMNRPLPAGRLGRLHALLFAVACGTGGLALLWDKTNPLTTALGAGNILLYAAVYTPLKQLTLYNTWVGALVGAIPPLMGWAAAAGELQAGAAVLALALFSWQMPHFLSLAWLAKDDYLRGGFRMLPYADPRGIRTTRIALRHTGLLAGVGVLAVALGVTTAPFMYEAVGLAALLGIGALRFAAPASASGPSQQAARRLFRMSLLYLPVMLVATCMHRLPNPALAPATATATAATATATVSSADAMEVAVNDAMGRVVAGLPVGTVPALEGFVELLGAAHARGLELLFGDGAKCPSKAFGDDQVDAMTQTTQAAGAGGSEGGSTDASPPQAPASVQKRSASKH